jgi:hypothetical protein
MDRLIRNAKNPSQTTSRETLQSLVSTSARDHPTILMIATLNGTAKNRVVRNAG